MVGFNHYLCQVQFIKVVCRQSELGYLPGMLAKSPGRNFTENLSFNPWCLSRMSNVLALTYPTDQHDQLHSPMPQLNILQGYTHIT